MANSERFVKLFLNNSSKSLNFLESGSMFEDSFSGGALGVLLFGPGIHKTLK